jgi:hypothetical protein
LATSQTRTGLAGPVALNGVLDVERGGTFTALGPMTVGSGAELISNGSVSFATFTTSAGFIFDFPLASALAGTGYHTIASTGPLSLKGTNLKIDLSFRPRVGTSFTLIHGIGNVTGQFANLPEGHRF